ncbi:MAG TPA: dihydrodipicolinate synthase family protein, partial [Vicinamibacteria bacterium]|nr:dihydrodipicolinate synthase family protein [Vicinamibacteria bacterium]
MRGIIPPLVTPFRADGALDLAAFEANLETYAGWDLGGYLVLGSNGEAATLEEDEKLALVTAARRLSSGRTLLVGTGQESTQATAAFTRKVADLGADAALVLTPHYYKSQM